MSVTHHLGQKNSYQLSFSVKDTIKYIKYSFVSVNPSLSLQLATAFMLEGQSISLFLETMIPATRWCCQTLSNEVNSASPILIYNFFVKRIIKPDGWLHYYVILSYCN